MRKYFLYLLAAFMLTSCDNLKKKSSSSEDETEETTTKKKKKPLDEEETADDEETPKKNKKTLDDEEPTLTNTSDEEDRNDNSDTRTTNYSKGWSSAEKDVFMNTCVNSASSGMGKSRAENYCSCMLEKIERLYPNANDAGRMTSEETTELARECLR